MIFPMVLCVIVMLIWGSYYMYDRAIISQDCYVLAFRASVKADARNKISPSAYVASKAAEQAGARYFGAEKPSFSVKQSGKEVMVTGETRIRTSAMGRYFLKIGTGWELKPTLKAKIRNDPGHVRRIKRLMDIGDRVS